VYQINFPQRYSSPLSASIESVCKCSNGHNMRFAIHLRLLQSVSTNGTRMEHCVAVSKENSAISLYNRDISNCFLRYHVVIGTV